jgi:DNA-binding CsgD family transcriptional regulator
VSLHRKPTAVQLEMILLVSNGYREDEIAARVHRSKSNVQKTLAAARSRMGATHNAHLVSLTIAAGLLVWNDDDDERILPNEKGEPTVAPLLGGSSSADFPRVTG